MKKFVSVNFKIFSYILLILVLSVPNVHSQTKDLSEMSLEDLLTIEVSVASKKKESLSNTPAIVTSIKMEDMNSFGIRTLKDALAMVPGVVVQDAPVGSTSIMIRGISETFNQKVLFLLEGVPYFMSSHGDMPLLSMPADMIDRVEVIRGPGSVIYGTDATAGVINVILKKDAGQTAASFTGGSQGLMNFDANMSRKTEDGFFYFGGSIQKMANGYDALYPKTNLIFPFTIGKHTVDGQLVPFATTGTAVKKEEALDFAAGGKYKNLNFMGHIFKQTSNGLGGAPLIFQNNRLSYQGFLIHADYTQKISDVEINVYGDYNPFFLTFDIDNFLATKDGSNVVTSTSGKQLYKDPWTNNYRARLGSTFSYPFNESVAFLFGIENEYRKAGEYQKTNENESILALQSHVAKVDEISSFAQIDWTFGALRAVVGARFVNNQLAGSHISPRASLIYNFTESQSLKLMFSEGFNSPVLSQQDLIIPFVISGNKELQAEIIRSVDFAYTYSTSTQILIINGYFISTSNSIARVTPIGAPQPKYTNVDGFSRYGAEVDFQRSFGKFLLTSNMAYNAQGNKIDADDALALFVPAVTFNAGFRYKLVDNHSVGLSERFWSKRGGIDAQSITNVNYSFTVSSFVLFVNAENIFNQNIQNPDVNAYAIPSVPGGPGRTFYAGVRFSM